MHAIDVSVPAPMVRIKYHQVKMQCFNYDRKAYYMDYKETHRAASLCDHGCCFSHRGR